MSAGVDDLLAAGPAPPLVNGELVFETPWQGRVFGMARALADAGVYDWREFRECLIDEIGAWDRRPEGEFAYYDHFLKALETLLARRGLVEPQRLQRLAEALSARPAGHDHHHHHDQDHHDQDPHGRRDH